MSLAKRLLHPHYVANVILAAAYPAHQLINHPEYINNANFAAYSRYLFPAMVVLGIKVRGTHSAEELVGVIALYVKVYSLFGFWSINDQRFTLWGVSWSGWWRVLFYLLAWLAVFIQLPQPPYQGPSKVITLNPTQLQLLTTPNQSKKSKGKERADTSSELRNRTGAKIVELDEDGNPLKGDDDIQDDIQNDTVSELDPNHYWIIAFTTTWSSPCRYFDAVLARCSIAHDKKDIHFAKIDMDLHPEEEDHIAEQFKISLAATTIDLPTLILFKDGKPLKRLPAKLSTKVGGEILGKVGWDRSESSVVSAFELAKLGTGRESFASPSPSSL
ncbi:Thioredoxin- transmembrane protein 2 [Mortierella sp. GBA43]|nr:Thioredoxin- transmembrane protein 2 [Mortierella sp. GBA43]